ncbi:MAG: hypothetical protein ABSG46_15005 [Candidatus Binataceae bacterium]
MVNDKMRLVLDIVAELRQDEMGIRLASGSTGIGLTSGGAAQGNSRHAAPDSGAI